MDIKDWQLLYKIEYDYNEKTRTNALYTPYLNLDKNIMCMYFDSSSSYMDDSCVKLDDDIVEFYFRRELRYLLKFQGYSWCPNILSIIEEERKIFIEYNDQNCNHLMMDDRSNLDNLYPNWKIDVKNIIIELYDMGYYKNSLYPHCFFYDNNKNLKMIDYYATVDRNDCLLDEGLISPIIGADSENRYKDSTKNGYVDFNIFFQKTLLYYSKWPEDIFKPVYEKLYNE